MRKIQNIFRMKKGKIRNQRGVALIFTLGILGLLTVMALGFASTAMLNQKIASNSAGASSARMLAQVGVQRALTAVALYTADAANNAVGFSDIFSREYGSGKTGNQNTCDFIWKLTTKINDIPLYELPVDYDNKSGVAWQYVTDPSDTTNNTLIGRYAYVVVPYYGALDPSVNYGQSFGTDSVANPDNKLFTVYNIDMDKGISKGLKDTFGITSLEKTDGAIKTSLNTDVYGKRFYDLSDYVKRILYDKSWGEATGFENMLKRMKLFYYLKNIFAINPYAYPEAYWIDCDKTGSDQKRASDHYLHRLSLDALVADWEGVSDGNYASKIDSLTNADNITSLQYSSTAPGVSPLPWLAAWQGPESSDLESANWTADLQKKQIAANLIQYILGADKPSVSNVATNAFSDTDVKGPELEYLGIGRHPYINEIGVEAYVAGEGSLTGAADEDKTLNYTLQPYLSFSAELINMYTADYTTEQLSRYKLYFYGRFSFTCRKTPGGTDFITWSTGESSDSNSSVLLGSVSPGAFSNGYTQMTFDYTNSILSDGVKTKLESPDLTGTLTIPAGTDTTDYQSKYLVITGMNLQITKVVLVADSTLIRDYAMPEAASTGETSVGEMVVLTGSPNHYVKSYQTVDPRLNHYPTDWKKGEKYNTTAAYGEAPALTGDFTEVTIGTKNKPLDAYTGKFNGTDYDKETVTEIACTGTATGRLSSAMIRHGKMRSLAELGLIHRASPFQTLNLKKARYIKRDTELKKAGGASYKEGDANILDQLKLRGNDVMKQYGKVNINTASHETLQALFNSVPYQKLVDSPLPAVDAADSEIFKASPAAAKYVKDVTDAEVTGARKACGNYHPTASGDHPSCLACSIINRREVLQFKARSDLMLDLNDSAVWSNFNGDNENFYHVPALPGGATSKADALKAISVSGQMTQGPAETSAEITDVSVENDWEQEQLIGHLADVITAEPPDLCIIAIGQTLKDIGGSKVYRNWGMSSIPSIKDDYYSSSDDTYRLYRKAGYIRPGQTNDYLENNQSSSVLGKGILKVADTPISKDKDVELGVYDVGFDKITGESKMIVWVRKDPVTQKWKVVRTMYAE